VAERDRLQAERTQAVQARDKAVQDRDRVRQDLATLRTQQRQLQGSNAALAQDLAQTRQSLSRLQADYSSARSELSLSRTAELTYPKNELVYAGVVPSVRSLDTFLKVAGGTAAARGARPGADSPAARLGPSARASLETKLRGLNTSAFVICRAAQNSVAGLPVELTCDARANTLLYRAGQPIRQATINLQNQSVLQSQITELMQDTVLELTLRGVPGEYIANPGLDVGDLLTLLTGLRDKGGSTAVISIAAREDVRPSTRVDLYARGP